MIDKEFKEEIRQLIREELLAIIIEDEKMETHLTTYMKSILYGELKYLKMLNSGFQKIPAGTEFLIDDSFNQMLSNEWVYIGNHSDDDLRNIFNALIENNKIDTTFEIFISVIKNKSTEKINWIEKTKDRKAIGLTPL